MISPFTDAASCLADVSPSELASLLGAASDIVLVLDREGVITDLAYELDDADSLALDEWRGRALVDFIEPGSRAALRSMLAAAHARRHGLRQLLRHHAGGADEFAVSYVALPLGEDGRVVLLGRDQRALVQLRARLVSERMDYERRRREQQRDDARYRHLFEFSSEAQLLVDGATSMVREANAAAAALLGLALPTLAGARLSRLFERGRRAELQALCDHPASAAASAPLAVTAESSGLPLQLHARPLRGEEGGQLLIRLERTAPTSNPASTSSPAFAVEAYLAAVLRNGSDAVVLADQRGTIVWSNDSFARWLGHDEAAQMSGRALADYLAFEQLDLGAVLANLRRYERGQTLRGRLSLPANGVREVAVSVTALLEDTPPKVAFLMRSVDFSPTSAVSSEAELFRSVEALTDMVGKVPLKGMVRDATDRVEKMCIEAALRLTGNNRALAAKVLGMSRQGLYQKLHQFNLAEADDGETDGGSET